VAAILIDQDEMKYVSFPIEKSRTTVDPETGDVIVYGKATDCTVDTDDQIVDERWAAKAVQEWLATGANVRVQHNPLRDPAGIGVEAHGDGQGGQWVRARIFEPVAKMLVLRGALRAFSVGIFRPHIVSDAIAKGGRIIGGILGELSLVDRPANKNCGIEYQLAKAAKDGRPVWIGKMLGDVSGMLTKVGAPIDTTTLDHEGDDVVTVDLPRNAAVSVTPADLAKLLQSRDATVAMKRDFDRGVGGGVDRDELPDSDFGDPANRKYPIVTPGDVEDAGGLIGRAGDPEAVRRRIIAIARRKGPAFEAKIPDSWKDGKKAMSGADAAEKAELEAGDEAVEKAGAKKCGECGANYHSDSKLKKCSECGAKLPKATKGAADDEDDMAAKAGDGKKPSNDDDDDDGGDDADTGGNDDGDANDAGEVDDDDDSGDEKPVKKGKGKGGKPFPGVARPFGKKPEKKPATSSDDDDSGDDDDGDAVVKGAMSCAKCGFGMKGRSKFCPDCGTKVAAPDETKAGKPTPANGVTGQHANPVPAHREPDGSAVEAFESDADLPTDPDIEFKTAMRHRGLGIPGDLGVVHDLLCPAYHPAVAAKAHPHADLNAIDVDTWQDKAFDAATSGTFEEAEHATKRWQHAGTIAGTDPDTLLELRYEAYKAFKDANPGPGSFPTPSTITPGQFKRPYLGAGRARPSSQQEGPNTAPMISGQIAASDYQRGSITAGHAASSPANKDASHLVQGPDGTGQLTRVQYRGAQRANAAQAMNVMHDHIAQTFPDLCPMGPDHGPVAVHGGQPSAGAAPAPVGKAAKLAKKVAKAKPAPVTEPDAGPELVAETAKGVTPELLKAAVAEAIAPLAEQLTLTKKSLKAQRKLNEHLRKQIEALADLPDPTTAPFRGQAMPGALKFAGAPSASEATIVATRAQLALQRELSIERDLEEQTYSDDPRAREDAWAALRQLRGTR
jgi:hypothetical protein